MRLIIGILSLMYGYARFPLDKLPSGGSASEESTIQNLARNLLHIGMNNDLRDINFGIIIITLWIVVTIATGIYIESL